jgi:ATP-binding cassette subfamily B protein/subfamily B ATP-binding cassette protein MsbA
MTPFRRIVRYMGPHRGAFAFALGLVALHAALEVAKPWPLKIVVDYVLGAESFERSWLVSLGKRELLLGACASVVALQVALAAIGLLQNRVTIGIGQRMVRDLRSDLLAHLHRLSLGFFGRRPTADLVYRMTFDTFAAQSLAMNGIFPLVTAVLLLLGMTAVMLRMNALLAAIFLAVGPVLFLMIRALTRRIARLATETRERESRFLSETQRGVDSIHVVQAFTAEPREHARVMNASGLALSASLRLYLFETGYAGAVSVLVAVGSAAVLYAGGVLGLAGRLSIGDLIVFVTYLASLYGPINSLSQTVGLVQGAAAGARRVFEILDAQPEVRDAPGARSLGPVRGGVRFEDVSFAYGAAPDELALRGVSFAAAPGSLVALVGPTGAGKTTLASLVPRFYDPISGRVLLDDTDLRELRLASLRSQIGIVPQSPVLFPLSVTENIRYGRPEASDAEVRRAADLADVTAFGERLPRGFNTPVGPAGHALSQGQAQRITIARALVRSPRILILDEPTSALDAETEAYVMSGIERAMKSRTTFVIAHRLSTVQRADLVLVLDRGRLVETGSFESLRQAGGLFERLCRAHALFGGGESTA